MAWEVEGVGCDGNMASPFGKLTTRWLEDPRVQ